MQAKKPALPSKAADHYSNILLIAPDGQSLATIPAKRARWYWKHSLVEKMPEREGYTEVIRLTIEPTGRPRKHISPLENRCVVCGAIQNLSCHHVVPRAVRSSFPSEYKEHSHQWCVLLCEEHHLGAEKLARQFYEKPLQLATARAYREQAELRYQATQDWIAKGKRPEDFDSKPYQEARKSNVKIARAACVEELIASFGGIESTIEVFKQAFLRLHPRFVPTGYLQ